MAPRTVVELEADSQSLLMRNLPLIDKGEAVCTKQHFADLINVTVRIILSKNSFRVYIFLGIFVLFKNIGNTVTVQYIEFVFTIMRFKEAHLNRTLPYKLMHVCMHVVRLAHSLH